MAGKKKEAASGGSSIMKWDEELAKEAQAAAATEANTGGGKFLSVKGGILSWNNSPVPNNKLPVIILDQIFENVMYKGEFDPENPSSPSCFAFGRDEKEMKPHEVPVEAGTAEDGPCAACPMNKFGSADKGKGKACKNIRRLGLISAGQFGANDKFKLIDDPEYYEKSEVGFFKLSVTSVNGFAAYVKQVAAALKRPPYGIITRMSVQPDAKSQFKVVFEPMQVVPTNLMQTIVNRRKEVMTSIDFPYQAFEASEAKPKGKAAAAKGGKSKGRY